MGSPRRAEAEYGNARYAEALPLFQQAAEAYAQLAEELAAQPVEEERPAEERPAEAEQPAEEVPGEPEEAVAVSAEEAIAELIGTFCQAFEQEDLGRIRDEVYKGEMPRGNRDFRLRLEFVSTPGGWRLQRLEWR